MQSEPCKPKTLSGESIRSSPMLSVLNILVKSLPIFLAIFSAVVTSSKAVDHSRINHNGSAA